MLILDTNDTKKELTPDGLLRLVVNYREKDYVFPPLM